MPYMLNGGPIPMAKCMKKDKLAVPGQFFTPANTDEIIAGQSLSFSELLERAQADEDYPHSSERIALRHLIASFPVRSPRLRRFAELVTMDVDYTSITQSAELGRSLHAKIPFAPNDTILRVTKPLLLVPENAAIEYVCAFCFSEIQLARKCTGCQSTGYCNQTCQKAGWGAYHKFECKALARAKEASGRNAELPTVPRAMVQLLQREKTKKSTVDQRWKDMVHHFSELRERGKEAVDELVLQVQAVMAYGEFDEEYRRWALGLICRINCNAFRVTSQVTGRPLGLCFDPVLALLNHSCRPNAAVRFDGRVATVKALEPIQEGQEIHISYIDTTLDTQSRQAQLEQTYFFKCNCPACQEK